MFDLSQSTVGVRLCAGFDADGGAVVGKGDDALGVGVDRDVGVVRDDDVLTLPAALPNFRDDELRDPCGVETVLGLVEDQAPLGQAYG
ncbi:hypothetical protein GCM10017557_35020 [Streptomyces aurantiacus]|uniref:Uncharacterized protein n=1 Tax=Streptomyces aurantiacus TaxID=47760 RepID=A0A7G1NYX1_9ACTN|nr:hypothetical protein GCM10017557_35020 [Streptomyces aurantiacus]